VPTGRAQRLLCQVTQCCSPGRWDRLTPAPCLERLDKIILAANADRRAFSGRSRASFSHCRESSELHPREVLADLLGSGDFPAEVLDPERVAEITMQRLIDASSEVVPAGTRPKEFGA